MIQLDELVAQLDKFFDIANYNESADRALFPPGYESILGRFAVPAFLNGPLNGLALHNAVSVDRVYLVAFPSQNVLDKIIAREVERSAPGALIFSHHLQDYRESEQSFTYINEAQLEELKEHQISLYVCHEPLDCHSELSPSTALATALGVTDQAGLITQGACAAGVYGKVGKIGFQEFAQKCAEVTLLPVLRYDAIRHNGRPVQNVAIIAGGGSKPEYFQRIVELGCDTFVTGEWWLYGPGDYRKNSRDQIKELLNTSALNLIGTSHYGSEAVVMRTTLLEWFSENVRGVEPLFMGQNN